VHTAGVSRCTFRRANTTINTTIATAINVRAKVALAGDCKEPAATKASIVPRREGIIRCRAGVQCLAIYASYEASRHSMR
jgi:hypothetical protein